MYDEILTSEKVLQGIAGDLNVVLVDDDVVSVIETMPLSAVGGEA